MRGFLPVALAAALIAASLPATAGQRALVIGIDRYADKQLDIGGDSSSNDVARVLGMLRSNQLGYDEADIRVLADGAATREAILAAIEEWLIGGTAPGDRAFFYFSGLGYFQADDSGDEPDELDETLVPVDAVVGSDDPPSVSGMISDDELIAVFQRLAGRKATVVIDAGHSGRVTGSQAKKHDNDGSLRVASLGSLTRSIVVEPKAKAQKAEGAPLEAEGLTEDVAVFTATSGGQAPLITEGEGAFTKAFVEAVGAKGADANQNGVVSNAEILAFLRDNADQACAAEAGCELGLTPTLSGAPGSTPLADAPQDATLTADRILDYFAKGNTEGVTLEQLPPSPLKVGARDIHFRVVSPVAGNLVLLDLADDGTLTQLFPNQYVKGGGRAGSIMAGSPLVVPDAYYGIHFNATSPTSGTLVALVTSEPIELPAEVKARKIEVIPREEATEVFLPAIATALEKPADTGAATATRAIDWSVATLRYEIVE